MYTILFSTQARKDAKKLTRSHLRSKCEMLLTLIAKDPYVSPPLYEQLIGDFSGLISRRINVQHRIVYEVDTFDKQIKVHRMWTHYE
ncbi:MAG: Txe/YoeB family addiction module toxin [Alphaproteobacteria bacterium]|nr:Txe/YoeB family addiction module toxin [Alphaproteobacteria bacterium]